ncbi:hypothetical protein C2S52_020433 [Perilla frutescens var. hirtella]|nr:hypothetical protein C2S52_020433 [Perilla frutescens var. hirtella]KAH6805403.1 hypothetical protein C2S51_030234 [Perilla frutescens var. frutescens]
MTINTHNHNHNQTDSPHKMQRCQDYIHSLEEERRKIQVFQRELPLCLELVTQAIEACKLQLSGTTSEYNLNLQSECSEQTSSDAPVLEEFIPLKRASSQNDGEEQESKKPSIESNSSIEKDGKSCKKSDWLRSVQLWNQTPDPISNEESPKKVAVVEVKRNGSGGAFHPFKKEKSQAGTSVAPAPPVSRSVPVPPASTSSSAETGGGSGGGNSNKKVDKEQSSRKARRCWSTELHRKFLQSLQQLGGSHLATPKQIRELMKVDGLTNDEVKSHLQKYRLHTRRPSPSIQNNNNNNTQAPQFVVVGGIWVPPEYASMATTSTSGEASGVATSNGIYAPIATLPTPFREASASPKQRQHKPPQSDSEGGVRSHSPATSSSTHTTTTSPPYS